MAESDSEILTSSPPALCRGLDGLCACAMLLAGDLRNGR